MTCGSNRRHGVVSWRKRLAMREGLGALTLEKKKLAKASYVRQKSHVSSHDKLEGWRATEKGHDMTM